MRSLLDPIVFLFRNAAPHENRHFLVAAAAHLYVVRNKCACDCLISINVALIE